MNTDSQQQLIEYGRVLMARVAGGKTGNDPPWVNKFLDLLNPARPVTATDSPLATIFSLVNLDGVSTAKSWVRPVPLQLADGGRVMEWMLMPVAAPPNPAGRQAIYTEFARHADAERGFEHFFYLMRKYASTLPNTYGEPGVSLFEQWKMIVALAQISGDLDRPPVRLGLVGGDIPGIQRTINTITSKGAAKAMRGRSAFIQLLGHALVERLLDALDLGTANVVYDAGGNFVLLTGWADDLPGRVQKVTHQVNEILLAGAGAGRERFDGFHGDLAVALAAVELKPGTSANLPITQPVDVLRADLPPVKLPDGRSVSRWQLAEKLVKDAVAAAKSRPFGDLAQGSPEGWSKLFGPDPAETADFCAVCRRQRGKDERFESLESEGEGQICPECKGFNKLANDLGHGAARLTLSFRPPMAPQAWQQALCAISGRWYAIGRERQAGDLVLALDPDDFPAPGVDGFRLFAHTTPMTGEQIKTNEELAKASESGLIRLGVLRIDVDNLGDLIVRGLPARTAMQTAELS